MLKNRTIAFIGAGAMTESILSGLLRQQEVKAENIFLTNRSNRQRLQQLITQYSLRKDATDELQIAAADIILLVTKPKDIAEVLEKWGKQIQKGQLLISLAAGISLVDIEKFLAPGVAVVRTMPNTSSAVGLSATALCCGRWTREQDAAIALQIFRSIGTVLTVEEDLMDAVTGLSGSGPAYVYYLVEALEAAGVKAGLSAEIAQQLTLQTLLGAAQMLMQTGKEANELRREVTSPNGTTMAGLAELRAAGVKQALQRAVMRATERSAEMGRELSKQMTVRGSRN